MYYSKYIRKIYNNGVKLYFCGKPVNPPILRYCFRVDPDRIRMSAVYDPEGNLREVRYTRC